MNAEGEVVDTSLLAAKVEDANLGVRHTSVEARLRVRLLSISSQCFVLLLLCPFSPSAIDFGPTHALRCSSLVFSSVGGDRQIISYLVLAVAVASRGTTGHFDGISVVDGREGSKESRRG